MRVALVHEWLDTWGGSEAVLAELLRVFPGADVYTLVDFLSQEDRARLGSVRIATSPFAAIPAARRWFRYAAVLRPQVIERFDLTRYDVVVSNSHAIAKGARTGPGQVHVCYCHTPARFAWTMAETYAEHAAADAAWRRPFVDFALARFRRWDRAASARVDRFVANSRHIATAIARCYGREADVVYPPVDVDRFVRAAATRNPDEPRSEYVTVSRLVPYKRIDLLVEAFRALPERRLVVVGDGPERSRLEALRVPNVEFAGQQDDAETARRVADARAFLFAAEEDFGIAPVEAQAAGIPVIAFGRAARGRPSAARTIPFRPARSSMRRRRRRWSPPCVAFEANAGRINAAACRDNALRFAPARFREEIARVVDQAFAARARAAAAAA